MHKTRKRARVLRNNATNAERHLWRFLRNRQLEGFRFRRQVPLSRYIVDFACPQAKLIVELDGGQHLARARYDASRTRVLEALGYRVLRYWNDDVLLRTEDVVADIYRELTKSFTPPQPSPSLCEREGATATATATETATPTPTAQDGDTQTDQCLTPSLSPQAKGRAGEGCS